MRIRGMHVPAPIARLFGRGSLLQFGLAFVGALFAVMAEGFTGIAIFIIILLALVVSELWQESERLTKDLEEARTAGQMTTSRLDGEIEKARMLEARDEQARELEGEVEWLRGELQAQASSPSRLLNILVGHADLIELIRKHRELMQAERPGRWTALRIRINDEKTAYISSYAEGCDYADGELVALIGVESGEIQATATATMQGQLILVTMPLDVLPREILASLEIQNEVQPEAYALELAGLAIKTYDSVSDAGLRELEQAVTTARQGAFRALHDNPE